MKFAIVINEHEAGLVKMLDALIHRLEWWKEQAEAEDVELAHPPLPTPADEPVEVVITDLEVGDLLWDLVAFLADPVHAGGDRGEEWPVLDREDLRTFHNLCHSVASEKWRSDTGDLPPVGVKVWDRTEEEFPFLPVLMRLIGNLGMATERLNTAIRLMALDKERRDRALDSE